MNDFPCGKIQDEEYIESFPEEGIHGEEVTGEERFKVRLDELFPGEGGFDLALPPEILQDGGDSFLVQGYAEFEEFPLDALNAPEDILVLHPEDKLFDMRRGCRPSGSFRDGRKCPERL